MEHPVDQTTHTPAPSQPAYTSPAGRPAYPPSHEPPLATGTVRPRLIRPSDRRDTVLAALLLILAVVSVNLSLYGGFHLGYTISYGLILVCGGVYLRPLLQQRSLYSVLCASAAVAGTGIFVWHNDGLLRFFAFCGIAVLTTLALVEAAGIGRRDSGTVAALLDVGRVLILRPFHHMSTAIPAIFLVQKGEAIEKRRFGGVLLGLFCALPVLLVVVPLLMEADAAFEGLLLPTLNNLGELIISLLLGLALFCLLFSLCFGLRHDLPENPALPRPERKGVSAMAINTFLGTIGAVYVLYLFSQLAYFFSAFSGILPEEYTVAQYARRGFFEMCIICTINLALVAVSLYLSRKQAGKVPLSTRLIALFILGFSLGLVATALSKMVLYIDSFGMTRLRILTSVFMLMLAAVLAFAALRLFKTAFPYMKATVITVALLGLVAGYMDVDTVIARYNIETYRQGHLEELDTQHLTELSDGAVPYLINYWRESKADPNHHALTNHLRYRLEDYGEIRFADSDKNGAGKEETFTPYPAPDLRAFNVDAARARKSMLTYADDILETYWDYIDNGGYGNDGYGYDGSIY